MQKGALSNKKILKWSELDKLNGLAKGRKKILVGGCFDVFHYGHLTFLKKSKEKDSCLILALESDRFIRERKKRAPVHTQSQRAEILSEFCFVDIVILLPYFSSDNGYYQLVKKIRPSIIAVSANDYNLEKKRRQGKTFSSTLRIVTPLIRGLSTTSIIKKIQREICYS